MPDERKYMENFFKVNTSPCNGLRLDESRQGSVCRFTITNESDRPQRIGDITLLSAKMMFTPDTEFYGEGYNMLSQYGGTITDFRLLGSFSDYDHYKLPRPEGMNQVYNMAVFYPKGESPLLIGFSSCRRFNGWIRFNTEVLEIALNCENILIGAGETVELEEIFIERGDRNTLLNNFAEAISKNHPKKDFSKIPTGWCSWLVYGPNITAKNIYDNLDAIKENGLDLEYIQIDDGYQAHWGDWFDFTDKFEGGVKQVCLDIKAKGFEPAIWVAPFVAERDSALFKNHPDWFVRDENGEPLASDKVTFGGWRCAPWYILDTTNPKALDYIKIVFSVMRNEWQIKYFKLDAIVWEALPFGVRYDGTKTSVEAFKMGMDAINEGAGDDSFILGGNSPMWPSIGHVNGMRVTNDNCRTFWHFSQLARECFNRNWQHNRLWINDPDTVLLQNEIIRIVGPDGSVSYGEGKISDDEFAFNAAYTLASGGMTLSGDDVSRLTPENMDILRRLLPPTGVAAEFETKDFTLGRAVLDEDREIIYAFNFENTEKDVSARIDKRCRIYDIIEDKELGVCEAEICIKGLRPHHAKALLCEKIK